MLSRRRNLILVVLAAALASAGLIFYAWRAAFKAAGEVPAPEGAYKSAAFGVFARSDGRISAKASGGSVFPSPVGALAGRVEKKIFFAPVSGSLLILSKGQSGLACLRRGFEAGRESGI